jgi:NADH-quinone oxidoreductase subunit C
VNNSNQGCPDYCTLENKKFGAIDIMTKEALKIKIVDLLPVAVFEETGEWLTLLIEAPEWPLLPEKLRFTPELHFDFLFCLTCIDWKTHFTVLYHFRSTVHHHTLVVKAKTTYAEPEIASVSQIWRTAEFHEREVFDLFGVKFTGHPDLRRLLLTDDWKGFPLRKDYEDPVNMIKL